MKNLKELHFSKPGIRLFLCQGNNFIFCNILTNQTLQETFENEQKLNYEPKKMSTLLAAYQIKNFFQPNSKFLYN